MHYIYIIQNQFSKIYIGYTNDIKNRLNDHNSGKCISTRGFKWCLIYCEIYLVKQDAINRERNLKHYGQSLAHLKKRVKYSLQTEISAG